MGVYLDVKSAYPSIHKRRLVNILEQKSFPPYLCSIIDSFFSDKMTILKVDSFISPKFEIPYGLLQGSPLLVTLYLLYNSSLLLPNHPSLNKDNISIAYIDDVTNLMAVKTTQQGLERARELITRSKTWGSRYGAIFDDKKTNFLLFTKKKHTLREVTVEGTAYTLQMEVK
ncbi:hypothetical protein O181_011633 [Austropuccinia psidii MF-1]|uniref:Reverse transcriptase domain-containing protein n=1 Tax=Austropuccinia psidii MF-1 TaxID=1389203 RepID=A0A9Q3BV86_9BASI|nr:hypothetical protein [Austropuccinia psidii MF-1]